MQKTEKKNSRGRGYTFNMLLRVACLKILGGWSCVLIISLFPSHLTRLLMTLIKFLLILNFENLIKKVVKLSKKPFYLSPVLYIPHFTPINLHVRFLISYQENLERGNFDFQSYSWDLSCKTCQFWQSPKIN